MSRYFVTGATGFLGRHLVDQLGREGHEVVALCRKPEAALSAAGVNVRLGDATDPASVRDAAAGSDGAFHCAGKVSRNPDDAETMYRVHVEGTKATLDALAEARVPRVVVASTSGVIAISSDPDAIATEDDEAPMDLVARWPYYRSKLYAERAALDRQGDDLEVVVVNPSLLLGPGDTRGSSTEDVRLLLDGKVPFCPGGGIAFVDARDAACAMRLAMAHGRGGRRYIVNAANMTLEVFLGRVARIADIDPPALKLPRATAMLAGVGAELLGRAAGALGMASPIDRISAEMAQYFWYCDATRAKAELGWTHRDPGETLTDTVSDLCDRGVVWPR